MAYQYPTHLGGQVNNWVNNTAQQMPALQHPTGVMPTNPAATGAPNGNPGIVPPPVPAAVPPAATPPVAGTVPPAATPPVPAAPAYADKDAWRMARPQFTPGMSPEDHHSAIHDWRNARPDHQDAGGPHQPWMQGIMQNSPSISQLTSQFPQLAGMLPADPADQRAKIAELMAQHGANPEQVPALLSRINFNG